jgi:acetyl esterase
MRNAYHPDLADAARSHASADLSDLAAARALEQKLTPPGSDQHGIVVIDLMIPNVIDEHGPPVPVRVYRPDAPRFPAAVLNIHGGGFVLGGLHTDDVTCRRLCADLGVVLVSVDYRLAPEHPFPAGLDDCLAALEWMARNAVELGVDARRIAVRGLSAGGGLAAAVALWCRDRGGPALCFQFLGVPALDDRLATRSMQSLDGTPGWNRSKAEWSWAAYLGGAGSPPSAFAAPARATSLANLPPAYVSAMEFDVLRDEAVDYALRMLDAGVAVELHLFSGTFHGSFVHDSAVSRREIAEEVHVWLESPLCRPRESS